VNGAGCHERGDVPGVTTGLLRRLPRRRRRLRPLTTAASRATSPGSPGTGCRRSSTSSSSSRAPEQPRTRRRVTRAIIRQRAKETRPSPGGEENVPRRAGGRRRSDSSSTQAICRCNATPAAAAPAVSAEAKTEMRGRADDESKCGMQATNLR